MAIEKADLSWFGAKITFKHQGLAKVVDIGWAAHLGEQYIWAYYPNVEIPHHINITTVSITLWGYWDKLDIPAGRTISAQAVIAPAGALDIISHGGIYSLVAITPELAKDMKELNPYLEKTYYDIYKTK